MHHHRVSVYGEQGTLHDADGEGVLIGFQSNAFFPDYTLAYLTNSRPEGKKRRGNSKVFTQ